MDNWLSSELIKWYNINKRDLPWRHEKDAYRIWLSEIILQQTQVVQGLSYYYKFVNAYPTVKHLAKASEDEVLKLWQGLGYYSRARNLLATAKAIAQNHKGKFPNNYKEIRELKGVGYYTAAALASFAFNLPHAVVDGNVYRFLSRLFGINTPIDSSLGKKQFFELAQSLLDVKNPGIHNQAIMEFGSQFCKPLKPNCPVCVLKAKCVAFSNDCVDKLPVKAKKTKVKKRYFSYLVITDKNGDLLLRKRTQNDIWQGLYEFVLHESSRQLSATTLFSGKEFEDLFGKEPEIMLQSKEYKHILSHQHLYAKFYVVRVKKHLRTKNEYIRVNYGALEKYAFPRLIEKFMATQNLKEIYTFD